MTNEYVRKLKKWYGMRLLREKILFIMLCWATLYAIFSILFIIPLDKHRASQNAEIKNLENQIENWNIQIHALHKIADSSLYKDWISQEKQFDTKRQAYRTLLRATSNINWEDVIKSILLSDSSIIIEQIKNSPEELYVIPNVKTTIPVYQQKLVLIIFSNYFDTLSYLKKLQNALPTIHWNSMTYQVQKYPYAKVELEFAVLYEKNM